jgi:4-hydroxybenzoate polyprenyltransferase
VRHRPGRAAAALLASSHPQPTVAVTTLVTVLAVAAGRGATSALIAVAVLVGQLSIGWANDALDAGRDRAAGRLDKPVARGEIEARTVGTAAAVAAVLCVPLSLLTGVAGGLAHLVGVGCGWAYDLGLKRTLLSPVPYAVAFGLLPAFVTLGLPGRPWPHSWVVLAAALLGTGAHFLNVVPDVEADLAAGIRGLPQRVGARASRAVGALLLSGAALAVAVGPPGRPSGWALAGLAAAVVLGVVAAAAPRGRWPFVLALVVAALDVALLVGQGSGLA